MNPGLNRTIAESNTVKRSLPTGKRTLTIPGKSGYVSLILRMWMPSGDEPEEAQGRWRIELEHFQSGGHWVFFNLTELERFLTDFLELLKVDAKED